MFIKLVYRNIFLLHHCNWTAIPKDRLLYGSWLGFRAAGRSDLLPEFNCSVYFLFIS